jgi:signal peptidase I
MKDFVAEIAAFVWEILKIVVVSLLIIIPVRFFVIQPFFVRGESMAPSFHNGEYLIVDEISYRFDEPRRGDVIVFRVPRDPRQHYIKRIVGLPGETVVVRNGVVTVYNRDNPAGTVLEEMYLSEDTPGSVEVRLDNNEYFVLGDNRDASSDSRRWGPVPEHLLIGKVWLRAWPIGRAQAFETPSY